MGYNAISITVFFCVPFAGETTFGGEDSAFPISLCTSVCIDLKMIHQIYLNTSGVGKSSLVQQTFTRKAALDIVVTFISREQMRR